MRPALLALAALLPLAAPAAAQPAPTAADPTAARLPRWHVGVAVDAGQPVGELRRNVKTAAGAQAHALLRLDRAGRTALRLQAGWLNYGHESQRSCLGTAPHCRVAVNLTTANGILSLALGPQLSVPLGRGRTYGYGLVGLSRFATVSGLGGGLVPDVVAGAENHGDGGVVWSAGAGLQWPVTRRASVDLGVGYERHGAREYLIKGGLTDRPDGTLGLDLKRSNASMFAMRLGVTTAIGRKPRQAAPAP